MFFFKIKIKNKKILSKEKNIFCPDRQIIIKYIEEAFFSFKIIKKRHYVRILFKLVKYIFFKILEAWLR